jgi:hypothetical protein
MLVDGVYESDSADFGPAADSISRFLELLVARCKQPLCA